MSYIFRHIHLLLLHICGMGYVQYRCMWKELLERENGVVARGEKQTRRTIGKAGWSNQPIVNCISTRVSTEPKGSASGIQGFHRTTAGY